MLRKMHFSVAIYKIVYLGIKNAEYKDTMGKELHLWEQSFWNRFKDYEE